MADRILLLALTTPLGIPGVLPFSHILVENTEKLNFMAFTTPVLALAGYSVARDLPIFRQLSWRIVVVSLTAAAIPVRDVDGIHLSPDGARLLAAALIEEYWK